LTKNGSGFFGDQCVIIGEVAQAHDGSLGLAHAFIDAIARAGADAVKFQTHIAHAESTPAEPWRVAFSLQDRTRYEYWKRMEFREEEWLGLANHARAVGLKFLSSPFSLEAIELLQRVGVDAWKVASGEVSSHGLLARMAGDGLPVLLSSGMSDDAELDAAVEVVKRCGAPLAVLQCTTANPCPPERIGLNLLPMFRERYNARVGLSDHSGTIFPSIAAAVVGCDVLEVHVTLSREMFGPDVVASVTTAELQQLVTGVRFVETMMTNAVTKDESALEVASLKNHFTKSVVASADLAAGTILAEEHLALKKPGFGIHEAQLPTLLGRRLSRPVSADTPLHPSDIE
jgi:N,N'-diacetyllegionaminate synthase